MKIVKAFFTPGTSAFFFDDQRAIKKGAGHDGFVYEGNPVTERFSRIREAGQSLSVQLLLEDGQIALGDCAAVQYSGAGGRDPLFLAEEYMAFMQKNVAPMLEGCEIKSFREMTENFMYLEINGKRLHTALRYGLSQALLDARAKSRHLLPAEIICEEYNLPVIAEPVPIFGQTGDNRYENVDKMILKNVDVIPHGLINNIDEKLGRDGEKLREYIRWLAARVKKLRINDDYAPALHLDVYGTVGIAFNSDFGRIAEYLASLEKDADGLPLYIEGPCDMEEKDATIDALAKICRDLEARGSNVKIVADEWCNTFEDVKDFADAKACHMAQIKTPDLGGIQNIVDSVLYCKEHGVEAYTGGTCNETDVSARMCVHLAVAARSDRMLAKPGMGFDEGYTIVKNEMERILTVLRFRNGSVK
ncbi:methylaspartate ammonia-lyase [Myxococcota bacterium]|nr:methylaspartate ammonia-lyase [Myxococcota bacterium]MBU1382652.1 methylaspartate ammonia-lyase [Myxococcota bacterium]MBU1497256.1 methylaspartate ammonia-lyase [Myxococcota bacterium]